MILVEIGTQHTQYWGSCIYQGFGPVSLATEMDFSFQFMKSERPVACEQPEGPIKKPVACGQPEGQFNESIPYS